MLADPRTADLKPKSKKNEALWLLSFSDMSLTLMCFFVLMISMMKPDKEQFHNMNNGMQTEPQGKQKDLKGLSQKLGKLIIKRKLNEAASVRYEGDGVRLEFKDSLVFDSGSSEFRAKSIKDINTLIKTVSRIGKEFQINVEGHTDDTPLATAGKYPSNWELSAARGITVMHKLQELGMPEDRIYVSAFAHTKPKIDYHHLKGKQLEAARVANRRVVLWIQ